jgi:hypothetical protein
MSIIAANNPESSINLLNRFSPSSEVPTLLGPVSNVLERKEHQ